MNAVKQYLPSLWMVLAAIFAVLSTALTDGVTTTELLNVAITGIGAFATYMVPNFANAPWLKTVTAFLLAALNATVSYVTDGISSSEWMLIAVAALGALGVSATNKYAPQHASPA